MAVFPVPKSALYAPLAFCTGILFILAGPCPSAHAQAPTDNDAWKSRCLALSANADSIDKGSASTELQQGTKGIAGAKFAAVAHERGGAGQHYVACTLYYTAAIAERMGNEGKPDPSRAHADTILAGIELKRISGKPLSFKEKMNHTSGDVKSMANGGLSPAEIAEVFGAFGNGG
jgi:hypothetical protein